MIREMTAADIEAVTAIDSAAFTKAWRTRDFEDELAKDYSYWFIAERDGTAAGYAGIWCVYETAELIRIAAAPKAQRRGIASELTEHIIKCAKEHGCDKMMLEVRESNSAARALYKKYGFYEISVRKGYYDGENAVIMEKDLV